MKKHIISSKQKVMILCEKLPKNIIAILILGAAVSMITFSVLNAAVLILNIILFSYPAKFILEHICKKGGNIILSSDSHTKENLCFDFESTVEYIKSIGFKTVKTLADGKFKQITL